MIINTSTDVAQLVGDEDEVAWVKDFLTFETKTFIRGKYRISSRSYLDYKRRFPVGLTPMIERHATRDGLEVVVNDVRHERVEEPPLNPDADLSWLYPHQKGAVDKCLLRTRGMVASPTGSGKGEIITGLVWSVDCKWIVLVHRDHLVEDLGTRFANRTGEEPGWIRSGMFAPQRVTFATFQSVYARLKNGCEDTKALLNKVRGMAVDEAHVVAADSYAACARECVNTWYRLGFSGTPFDRTDARSIGVISSVGPCIYRITSRYLIDNGYIPEPIIRMMVCAQRGTNQKKFNTVYKHTLQNSVARNALALEIMQDMAWPGIAFVKRRDHGLELERMACDAGINAVFIDGKSSKSRRKTVQGEVRRGAIDILISTVVFQEGLDVPELRSVFNVAGGKSAIEILQRLGRGMRKEHDEDDTFELWDIFDVVLREKGSRKQKWLQKHARERAVAMAKQGYDVHLVGTDGREVLFDPDNRIDWDT